jgi:CDP-diacylglycerol--glycerol-3-phosphate 3-phosphatidyltransferase
VSTKISGKFEPSALATPANAITAVRLLATLPVVVLIVQLGISWVAAFMWAAVASTDFLDGWIARRQGATTSGAFLDPLADKVLILGALAALAATGLASWIPVLIIAGREVAISAYRSIVARNGVSVPARPMAKAKTAAQDFAVFFILVPPTGLHHPGIGQTLLWISVGLALVSGAQYLLDSRRPALAAHARPLDDLPSA